MLALDKMKSLSGCDSSVSCLAEIGGALGVELMIAGRVGKLGNSYVINLQLVNTKKSFVEQRLDKKGYRVERIGN